MPGDRVPSSGFEGLPHGGGRVADTLEAVEDVRITIDVTFGDIPVVRAGIARLSRVAQHEARCEIGRIHVEGDAPDDAGSEFERRDAPMERRAVVLQAGGHPDDLRLDVLRRVEERLRSESAAAPGGQRTADGDVEGR